VEPVVVCVHGYCQSSSYWAPTLDHLAAAGARGLTPDLPGFGASARVPGPYTMEAYADRLVALLDARGLGRVALVGGSMGGVVAQHLTLRNADRVSRLLLVATGAATADPAAALARADAIASTPWDAAAVAPVVAGFFRLPPPARMMEYQRIALAASQRAAVDAARSNAGSRTLERLGEIRVPTLIIQGRHDRSRTPEHGVAMRDRIPGARLVVLEGSGHTPQIEEPEPTLAHRAREAERYGLVPSCCPKSRRAQVGGAPVPPLQGPGVALLTSGSTGPPQPVFHTTSGLVQWVNARNRGLGLGPGAGVIMEASPAYGQGLSYLVSTMVLGGPLGLLDPRDHRLALTALAEPAFRCCRVTAHFADVLSRCVLTEDPVIPPVCILGTPISQTVRDAFQDRFGVPLRQEYSSTETGTVAVDGGPPADVRPETVGRPLPGVEMSIGDHPGAPRGGGEAGRIWIRNPWRMAGYGFPPRVERSGDIDGWWPTRDLGMFGAEGRLTLTGRLGGLGLCPAPRPPVATGRGGVRLSRTVGRAMATSRVPLPRRSAAPHRARGRGAHDRGERGRHPAGVPPRPADG
jgi:pimeloyl-ACP methyl ester carboxylesterase